MKIQYVTPGVTNMIRHAVDPIFIHTYTRTVLVPTSDDPVTTSVDESIDAWGEQATTNSADTLLQPCLYTEHSQTIVEPNGPITVNLPTLLIPNGDPLSGGDRVSNIATLPDPAHNVASVVLIPGPLRVEGVTVVGAEFGGAIYQVAFLRQIEEVLG